VGTVPTALAIAPSGQILVADNSPSQQILVFDKVAGGQTQLDTALGTRNGIFHTVEGTPGNWRFNGITGIGFDQSGNLYVGQNNEGPRPIGSATVGEGAVLESYGLASQQLNWRLYGLTFVDSGDFDPANSASVYARLQPTHGERMVVCGLYAEPLRLPERPFVLPDSRRARRADGAADQWPALSVHA
jgi:hypothetical protein